MDDDDGQPEEDSPPPTLNSGETVELEETMATLSLNSVVGISLAHTMKLAGRIGNHPVTVLIDS